MQVPVPSKVRRSFVAATAAFGAGLVLALSTPLAAQPQAQANYPLTIDLLDTTNQYGPVMLLGTTPPAPPTPATGACQNGIYFYNAGGQDIRTPIIGSLNTNDFQVDLEFMINALPVGRAPVFMGGHLWRFLGIYVDSAGLLGIKHNNSNHIWSTTTVTTGKWYLASLRYDSGTVELVIDGQLVHSASIGPLSTSTNLNFTASDFSNGLAHNGCIRNLTIYNDANLGSAASAQNYGSSCDNLTMSASGLPKVGNATFALGFTNVPAISALVYLAMGRSMVNPGLDLTSIGMGGCYSYTSLDVGVFGPSVAIGGKSSLPLPIPSDPTLVGAIVYTQGISMSAATTLGLATSNGTQLVIGN